MRRTTPILLPDTLVLPERAALTPPPLPRLRRTAGVPIVLTGLPKRPPGRPYADSPRERRYQRQLDLFAQMILRIRGQIDFKPGTRGWCYILEGRRFIDKSEFDKGEWLINELRKDGRLPIDLCAEDERRAAEGIERIDGDIPEMIDGWHEDLSHAHDDYRPYSFWDDKHVYIEIGVEKVDLKSLFRRVTDEYNVVIWNAGGWADLNVRYNLLCRYYARWLQARGMGIERLLYLGYCGDHDPGGMNISKFIRDNLKAIAGAVARRYHTSVEDVLAMIDHIHIERFGLNEDFIEANGLTWIDNLETSNGRYPLNHENHPDHDKPYVQDYIRRFGVRKCEANALVVRPTEGRQLCRDWIEQFITLDDVNQFEANLEDDRQDYADALRERFNLSE